MELIDFHVAQCRDGFGEQCRWLETSGRRDMVVILTRPRRHSPPSLTHLARLAVNTRLADLHLPSRSTDLLPVPQAIKSYLREYPYKVWTSAPLHVQVPCVARCRCTGLRARIHRKSGRPAASRKRRCTQHQTRTSFFNKTPGPRLEYVCDGCCLKGKRKTVPSTRRPRSGDYVKRRREGVGHTLRNWEETDVWTSDRLVGYQWPKWTSTTPSKVRLAV